MFLVEPRSGERWHYRSADALGAAIRRGELGPGARIFHQTTNRWLPITVHPQYRLAESERLEAARGWAQREWTFLSERPSSSSEHLFASIPTSPVRRPNIVLSPAKPTPSRFGLALRRVLQFARI
ncbi:MAG TPA: hypothetical protein VFM14_16435 [Gemmatimonadales bacterium]|nr:hypothetical protein [Gemmatimonadales bacterium]